MKAPKVFIDSNVWFSALYGSENCEKIIKAHAENRIKAVISQKVLKEVVKNFTQKMPKALVPFKKLILTSPPKTIINPRKANKKIISLVSKEDQIIFSSAILAKTPYFITGNIKGFKTDEIEKKTGIRIITPKQAVEILKL
jgi:putative PIN family toxin of toxin-antitoxin system